MGLWDLGFRAWGACGVLGVSGSGLQRLAMREAFGGMGGSVRLGRVEI